MRVLPRFPWERVRRRFLWMPGFWTAVIACLHAIPGEDAEVNDWFGLFHLDKVLHLVFFAVWGLSWWIALGKSGVFRGTFLAVLLVGILLGVGLEWAQASWFQGRRWDLFDVVADGLGVCTGYLAFRLIYHGLLPVEPIQFRHRS